MFFIFYSSYFFIHLIDLKTQHQQCHHITPHLNIYSQMTSKAKCAATHDPPLLFFRIIKASA